MSRTSCAAEARLIQFVITCMATRRTMLSRSDFECSHHAACHTGACHCRIACRTRALDTCSVTVSIISSAYFFSPSARQLIANPSIHRCITWLNSVQYPPCSLLCSTLNTPSTAAVFDLDKRAQTQDGQCRASSAHRSRICMRFPL